ncbi:MAG: hypothetical protein JXR97_06610 [Planctomycetes bacterium]|nr:hypothetical protein [Planctomycetota bacterium]
MPRTTKKAERAALHKARRKIRVKLRTKRRAKRGGLKLVAKSHPHRKAAAIRKNVH